MRHLSNRFESDSMLRCFSYKLVAIKIVTPGQAHLEAHYADLKDKPFFPGLIKCRAPIQGPPRRPPKE